MKKRRPETYGSQCCQSSYSQRKSLQQASMHSETFGNMSLYQTGVGPVPILRTVRCQHYSRYNTWSIAQAGAQQPGLEPLRQSHLGRTSCICQPPASLPTVGTVC
jgi:hypothetical protein